jgi:hypothetical protein
MGLGQLTFQFGRPGSFGIVVPHRPILHHDLGGLLASPAREGAGWVNLLQAAAARIKPGARASERE